MDGKKGLRGGEHTTKVVVRCEKATRNQNLEAVEQGLLTSEK